MDIIKQYIVQSISAASNNLRLNSQKIEIVALLRDAIIKSDNLENDLRSMKKITELSTLAIRLNDIYNYLTQPQVDLFKLSDKLKEHSQILIKDISHMLDIVSPASFRTALDKIRPSLVSKTPEPIIDVDLSKRKADPEPFARTESEAIKEQLILEEEKDDNTLFIQNYETEILKPIKQIDNMLKQLSSETLNMEDINKYAAMMQRNGDLSERIGFEIIANMHKILAGAFHYIEKGKLAPNATIVESMRACLIVIVAVVRGKEVNITNYLNRAEEFGRKILSIK